MKLLRLSTVYPDYLSDFYRKHSGFSKLSYSEQKATLNADSFGWVDYWSNAMKPLGYEGMEIEANVEPIQKKWAVENNFTFNIENWVHEIAMAQIKTFRPDILFLNDYVTFDADWIAQMRNACPSVRLVMVWCGGPIKNYSVLRACDLVLSCIPESVMNFRAQGFKAEHMHHAFDPKILTRIPTTLRPDIDFSFVGQIVRAQGFHREREELLKQIIKKFHIDIFSPSAHHSLQQDLHVILRKVGAKGIFALDSFSLPPLKAWLRRVKLMERANDWEGVSWTSVANELRTYMRPAVFGLKMFETLKRSRVTLNSHIDISSRSASNMRLFEATGVGTCLITDHKENLKEIFEEDKELVSYRSSEDCLEKVKWLLENELKRNEIAKAGQERCLKEHTFSHRALQLSDTIKAAFQRDAL